MVRSKRLGAIGTLAPIRFRPSRGVKGGDVCSKLVVFRERLQTIHFCTLERLFRDYPIVLGLRLPSTVSPPYVLIRAPSNVVRSKTSSSNPLLGTQRGDRNQAGENGRELGGGSLVDTIYCKSYTRTAAAIGTIQLGAEDRTRKFGTRPTSPVCDLSCSSSLHGLLYDLLQPEKVQWYFFFAFFTSEPLTKTNSDFCFELRGGCEDSTSDSGPCRETSLCS